MRVDRTFASLLALALFGLAARSAHAQSTCNADSECVKGWTCQVSGGSSCGTSAGPCAPGEKCETPPPSDCVNVEYKSCRPAPCHVDSDCAEGLVCFTETKTNCAPTACPSGQDCPAMPCEPTTESACVPRYVLPCTTASDCGTGFTCEPSGELCECSGSAGRDDASDGGAPLPPDEPSCICTPSKDLRCHAPTVTCAQDSDCTAGWSCAVVSSGSDCESSPDTNPTPGAGAQGGATPTPPDCRPAVEVKQCVPPYYGLVQGISGVERDYASGGPTAGAGDADTGDKAPVAPSAESGMDEATSSAGCSVTHGSRTGSTVALLGALGLFAALRRRRAR